MTSISDVSVCIKLIELAKSCGLRGSDIEGSVYFLDEDNAPDGHACFILEFFGLPKDPVKLANYERFSELLGIDPFSVRHIKVAEMSELEDILDQALARAPRAWSR
jgi:hypothetical protein